MMAHLSPGYTPAWPDEEGGYQWVMYVYTGECDCDGSIIDCNGECGGSSVADCSENVMVMRF